MPFVTSSSSSSSSCQSQIHSQKMFLFHKTSPLFLHKFYPQTATKFRCIPKKFTVSASLNTIAAAAASGSGATVHGAVSSAITQVAVTAFAIASGACLSTKVDFLWPKVEEQQGTPYVSFLFALEFYAVLDITILLDFGLLYIRNSFVTFHFRQSSRSWFLQFQIREY